MSDQIIEQIREQNDLSQIAVNELQMLIENLPANFTYEQFSQALKQMAELPGNQSSYAVNRVTPQVTNLTGKKILFLGSSVTFGAMSLGESFVDFLWKQDGVLAVKNAISGTTLANFDTYEAGDSYVARFQAEMADAPVYDAVVLQLSTNDAKPTGAELGEISSGHYQTKTIIGAIEYILSQIKLLWHCPVLLYSNPYFENQKYQKMVSATKELQAKWGFAFLNMYEDPDCLYSDKVRSLWMADAIHPTRAGYYQSWLPKFEAELSSLIAK